MAFIDRHSQLTVREWDRFSPFKRLTKEQEGFFSPSNINHLRDELLDGISLPRQDVPAHWVSENSLHGAIALSHRIGNTRAFLGTQIMATRDDVRQLSHFLIMEPDRLLLITTSLGVIERKTVIHHGYTRRAHLCLDNWTGLPSCIYVAQTKDLEFRLFLDGKEIDTKSRDIDFPFMTWAQAPKGHIPLSSPSYGICSYKCRTTGKLFTRFVQVDGHMEDEKELAAPRCLGGVDFAINGETVLFHVDAVDGEQLRPMTASSTDRGGNVSAFLPLDLQGLEADAILPAASPISRDYHGNFHIPIAAVKDGCQRLMDVHGADVTEAMALKGEGYGYSLLVFPKRPPDNDILGRGNGLTDGIGIIATTIADGKLMISNSQTGGHLYPKERYVNHGMAKMFAFRATECCYTRAQSANMVSMDYLFVESNDEGDPVSSTLWLETWDMPLPLPVLSAEASGNMIVVKILQDAWFEIGKTTFKLSDPAINIRSVAFTSDREAEIVCDSSDLTGKIIHFDMKSFLYWHAGDALIIEKGSKG